MVTLRQLRAFVVASRTLSFTRAARELHLTQSAVSLQIRDLEQALGLPLFERGRRLALTAAGTAFAATCVRTLRELDDAVADLRETAHARRRVVRVGVGHLLAFTVLPAALERFARRHPEVKVRIVDCLVEQLGAKVLGGEVEFAIGSVDASRPSPELRVEPLLRDSIHVASLPARARAVAGRRGLRWASLAGEPMILVNAANEVWRGLPAALAARGATLTVAHEVALYSTGLALARLGAGHLLLPGFCARTPELQDFSIRRLVDPVVPWNVSLLQRRGTVASAPAAALVDAVREVLG